MKSSLFTIVLAIIFSMDFNLNGQSNYGRTVLIGSNGLVAEFKDTARPSVRATMPNTLGLLFGSTLSSISDSLTGKPLFYCNEKAIFDTLGNIVFNGDHLTDSLVYNGGWIITSTQFSIILPLGNSRFAVIVGNATDSSVLNCYWNTNCLPVRDNLDELRFNVVDMKANGGNGAVVVKNKKLITRGVLNMAQMTACRHGNGKDWWLLKPGNDSTETMYSFLITADSVFGPFTQPWVDGHAYVYNQFGQLSFSPDGSKIASVIRFNNKITVGDFDRCTGLISNQKIYNVPFDTIYTTQNHFDTLTLGVAFSPNNKLVYLTKSVNVFQLELDELDSSLAWYWVKHGSDVVVNGINMARFGTLNNGPDGRIYVGHWVTSVNLAMSVIDHPNVKGVGCGWCNLCLQPPVLDSMYMLTLSNQPNYNLGASATNCWPLSVTGTPHAEVEFSIYPNPTNGEINVAHWSIAEGDLILRNSLGQIVFEAKLEKQVKQQKIPLPESLTNGLYYYKCTYPNQESFAGKLNVLKE